MQSRDLDALGGRLYYRARLYFNAEIESLKEYSETEERAE